MSEFLPIKPENENRLSSILHKTVLILWDC